MLLAGLDGAAQLAHRFVELALEMQRDRFRERFAHALFLARSVRPCFHLAVDGGRRRIDIRSAQVPLVHVLVLSVTSSTSFIKSACAPNFPTSAWLTGALGAKTPSAL